MKRLTEEIHLDFFLTYSLYTALVDKLLFLKTSSCQRSAAIIKLKDEKSNITWNDVEGKRQPIVAGR